MTLPLLEAIQQRVLLGDGAMGTQLQMAGLEPGGSGEGWNVAHPDRILAIQKRYVDAGSDVLLTNTFGGCRIMLERHDHANDTVAINRDAVHIARQAFDGRPGYVIGDIGPFGGLLEPLGDIPEKAVRAAFAEQAKALVDAGADAIIIETQTSLEELGIGIQAAREAGAPCVIASMAFDVTFDKSAARTMMGIDPAQAAEFMAKAGVDIAALNCGTGIDVLWAAKITKQYRQACDLPVMAQPNAGQPVLEKMKVHYKQTPDEMSADLPELFEAGPRIIGGCCGSTPEHIAMIRQHIDQHNNEHNNERS